MHKVPSILLFCFISVLFAQDQPVFKNAVGWESGVSYRRYVNNSVWVGINATGSYDNATANDTQFSVATFPANDSTASRLNRGKNTDRMYSGTIKIELGKEIFTYKKLDIDAFVAAGYTHSENKTFNGVNESYFSEATGNAFLAIIAVEPKIFLWDRISIGTQLGLGYTYTNSKYNSNNNYTDLPYETGSTTDNRSTVDNNFRLFGNISLSSLLVIHYYF